MFDLSAAQWRKSSYSGTASNCVEVAYAERVAGVRDSKKADGPVLVFPESRWADFLAGQKFEA